MEKVHFRVLRRFRREKAQVILPEILLIRVVNIPDVNISCISVVNLPDVNIQINVQMCSTLVTVVLTKFAVFII